MPSFEKFQKAYAKKHPSKAHMAFGKFRKAFQMMFGGTLDDVTSLGGGGVSGPLLNIFEFAGRSVPLGEASSRTAELYRVRSKTLFLSDKKFQTLNVDSLVRYISAGVTSLKVVRCTAIPEQVMAALARSPDIRNLYIDLVPYDLTLGLLRILSPNLQSLTLNNIVTQGEGAGGGFAEASDLQRTDLLRLIQTQTPRLKSIDISGFVNIFTPSDRNMLVDIVNGHPGLTTLSLGSLRKPTMLRPNTVDHPINQFYSYVLENIVDHPGLRSLIIRNFNGRPSDLSNFIQTNQRITHLDLSDTSLEFLACSAVSGNNPALPFEYDFNTSVLSAIAQNTNIVHLNLSGLYFETPEHVHEWTGATGLGSVFKQFLRNTRVQELDLTNSMIFPNNTSNEEETDIWQDGIIDSLNGLYLRKLALGLVTNSNMEYLIYFLEHASPHLTHLTVSVPERRARRRRRTHYYSETPADMIDEVWERGEDDGEHTYTGGGDPRSSDNLFITEV